MTETLAIRFEGVTLRYRVPRERIRSIKEYVIRKVQRLVFFDEIEALRDFDLSVRPGETVGVIGRNGAGKSTLFKLIARVLYPSAGRVAVAGRIAPLLELGLGFHDELTGRENVLLQGALLGFSRREMRRRLPDIVAWSELAEFIDLPIRAYSSGMAARLAFASVRREKPCSSSRTTSPKSGRTAAGPCGSTKAVSSETATRKPSRPPTTPGLPRGPRRRPGLPNPACPGKGCSFGRTWVFCAAAGQLLLSGRVALTQ